MRKKTIRKELGKIASAMMKKKEVGIVTSSREEEELLSLKVYQLQKWTKDFVLSY